MRNEWKTLQELQKSLPLVGVVEIQRRLLMTSLRKLKPPGEIAREVIVG